MGKRQLLVFFVVVISASTWPLSRATVWRRYLSVILVQPFKLSSSMFLQFCEKVLQKYTQQKLIWDTKAAEFQFTSLLFQASFSPQGAVAHTQAPP